MPRRRPFRRLLAVGGFALFAGLALLETLPISSWLRDRVDPVADQLGLSQDAWGMFAPDVDSQNTRLSAEIEYTDGERRQWRSPDWASMNLGERFITRRESEYLDAVFQSYNLAAWPPLADDLARRMRPEAKPKRVRLYYATAYFPDPNETTWKIEGPTPFSEPVLFYEKAYPE